MMTATPGEIAAQLTPPQKVFLFCIASGTDWKKVKIQSPTVQLALMKNLVQRQSQSGLVLTDLGLAVLDVLLTPTRERPHRESITGMQWRRQPVAWRDG